VQPEIVVPYYARAKVVSIKIMGRISSIVLSRLSYAPALNPYHQAANPSRKPLYMAATKPTVADRADSNNGIKYLRGLFHLLHAEYAVEYFASGIRS
jgi:hypothetical protein